MRLVALLCLVLVFFSFAALAAPISKGNATAAPLGELPPPVNSKTKEVPVIEISDIDNVWLKISPLVGEGNGLIWDPEKGWIKPVIRTLKPTEDPKGLTITVNGQQVKKSPYAALLTYGEQFVGAPFVYAGMGPPEPASPAGVCFACMIQQCQQACRSSWTSCWKCVDGNGRLDGSGWKACQQAGKCNEKTRCRAECRESKSCPVKPWSKFSNCDSCQTRVGKPGHCRYGGFDCQGFVRYTIHSTWGTIAPKYKEFAVGVHGQYKKCQQGDICNIIDLGPNYDFNKLKPGDIFYQGVRDKKGTCVQRVKNDCPTAKNKDRSCMEHTGFVYEVINSQKIKILDSSGAVRIKTAGPLICGAARLNTKYLPRS